MSPNLGFFLLMCAHMRVNYSIYYISEISVCEVLALLFYVS